MRIWTEVSATVRAVNRLADSIRALAVSITELARVMRTYR
jgi:hypothetical protein